MAKKEIVGGVPGKLLGMTADLFHKLQNGAITVEELEKFLKRQDPFRKESQAEVLYRLLNEMRQKTDERLKIKTSPAPQEKKRTTKVLFQTLKKGDIYLEGNPQYRVMKIDEIKFANAVDGICNRIVIEGPLISAFGYEYPNDFVDKIEE